MTLPLLVRLLRDCERAWLSWGIDPRLSGRAPKSVGLVTDGLAIESQNGSRKFVPGPCLGPDITLSEDMVFHLKFPDGEARPALINGSVIDGKDPADLLGLGLPKEIADGSCRQFCSSLTGGRDRGFNLPRSLLMRLL
jgi:hypothetical protein